MNNKKDNDYEDIVKKVGNAIDVLSKDRNVKQQIKDCMTIVLKSFQWGYRSLLKWNK